MSLLRSRVRQYYDCRQTTSAQVSLQRRGEGYPKYILYVRNVSLKFSNSLAKKLLNETSIMDDKIEENNGKFKIVAANLTEQIQRQELHSKNAWVSVQACAQGADQPSYTFQKLLITLI